MKFHPKPTDFILLPFVLVVGGFFLIFVYYEEWQAKKKADRLSKQCPDCECAKKKAAERQHPGICRE